MVLAPSTGLGAFVALLIAAPAGAAISYVGSSHAVSPGAIVLANPAGTRADDVAVATVLDGGQGPVAPGGWTLLREDAVGNKTLRTWLRRFTATEPATWSFDGNGGEGAGVLTVWRGADTTNAVVEAVAAATGNNATVTWPSVTTASAGGVAVLHAGIGASSGLTPGSGWTKRAGVNGSKASAAGGEAALVNPVTTPAYTGAVSSSAWGAHVVLLRPVPQLTATFPADVEIGPFPVGSATTSPEQVVSVTSNQPWGLRVSTDAGDGRMRRWSPAGGYAATALGARLQWRRSSFDGAADTTAFAAASSTPASVVTNRAARATAVPVGVNFRQSVTIADPVPPAGSTYRIVVTYTAQQGF